MGEVAAADFGTLLRKFRSGAGFSQEELAERASISAKAVSALERGFRKTPYRETVRLLADALALGPPERGQLEAAARRAPRVPAPSHGPATAPNAGAAFPSPLTELVGRDSQLAEVETLTGELRLVTLAGAGGVGKTRLAMEVGERARQAQSRSVAFVDLSALTSQEYVVSRLAATLGVHERRGDLLEAIAAAFGSRQALLILDNCEHVILEAARASAFILKTCPGVTILATSREPLNIPGERVYRLPSLSVEAAVELFAERAASADGGFRLVEANSETVADICRRLDGIPLAIELAAMRTGVLGVERLAAKLDDRFRLLAGGNRIATPRQQTMRALIDWSYDLLAEPERRALRSLSIFSGGWTFEAAAAVCFEGPQSELDALDALLSLADKSLIVVEEGGADKRYRMLETIREYGLLRVDAAGERESLARRHARYFTHFAQETLEQWGVVPEYLSLARVEPELDNFRAAHAWSADRGNDPALGAGLAAALWRFWQFQVDSTEGLRWIEQALAATDPKRDQTLAASLLLGKAFLLPRREQLAAAYPAVAAYRELGEERTLATALMNLGDALRAAGKLAEAQTALEEAVEIDQRVGRPRALATALAQLATVRFIRGDIGGARSAFDDVIALVIRTGGGDELAGPHAVALTNLAELEFNEGRPERAIETAKRALEVSRRVSDRRNVALLCCNLAGYLTRAERFDEARVFAREGLDLLAVDRGSFLIAAALEALAHVAAAAGDADRAARLVGFADARREAQCAPREAGERESYERLAAVLHDCLGPERRESLYLAGACLSEDEAIRLGGDV
jgi:predicted ATPase/transcriptional regulator with XRE-family HTH domain